MYVMIIVAQDTGQAMKFTDKEMTKTQTVHITQPSSIKRHRKG